METRIIKIMMVVCIMAFLACEDMPSGTKRPVSKIIPPDTCMNDHPPIEGGDDGIGVPFVHSTRRGRLSHDGRYIAFIGEEQDYANTHRDEPVSGLAIVDVQQGRVTQFKTGFYSWYTWSKNDYTLYYIESGILCSQDVIRNRSIRYEDIGRYEWVEVSPSGKYLFLTGSVDGVQSYGIVRLNIETKTPVYYGKHDFYRRRFTVKDDSSVYAILLANDRAGKRTKGIYELNLLTGEETHRKLARAPDLFNENKFRGVLSPNGKKMIFDPFPGRNVDDGYYDVGVWSCDLETGVVRQILERHKYYKFYEREPFWVSDSRIGASWFCLKDSCITIETYNLLGQHVEALLKKKLEFWIVA